MSNYNRYLQKTLQKDEIEYMRELYDNGTDNKKWMHRMVREIAKN